MAVFAYKVRDSSGGLLEGVQDAEGIQQVINKLREKNYFIVDVREKSALEQDIRLPQFGGKVDLKDISVFSRQFATLVNAGVPIMTILKIMLRQAEKRQMKEALQAIIPSVESGQSLSDSFAQHPKVFPAMFTNLVAAGEIGGVLDDVMDRLAFMYEREHDINEKVKSALTYPKAIMVIAMIAISFLLIFVLPTFVKMLTDMNVEMPLPTKITMAVSNGMKNYWYIIFPTIGAIYIGLKAFGKTSRGRLIYDDLSLRLPVLGVLNRRIISSRFTRTMSTLLRGGVPIMQAMEVTKNILGNVIVEKALEEARQNVKEGHGMVEPLERAGIFPPMVLHMIAIGEESGALDTLLEKASIFYDKEVEYTVARLASMIEPIMIVFLGVIVAFIIASVMLPMFKIITAF